MNLYMLSQFFKQLFSACNLMMVSGLLQLLEKLAVRMGLMYISDMWMECKSTLLPIFWCKKPSWKQTVVSFWLICMANRFACVSECTNGIWILNGVCGTIFSVTKWLISTIKLLHTWHKAFRTDSMPIHFSHSLAEKSLQCLLKDSSNILSFKLQRNSTAGHWAQPDPVCSFNIPQLKWQTNHSQSVAYICPDCTIDSGDTLWMATV